MVSECVKLMNPGVFGEASGEGGAGEGDQRVARTGPEEAEVAQARHERDMQRDLEAWLERRGYQRLTAANAVRAVHSPGGADPRGWFGHLAEPRGNPLMPDVWIESGGRTLRIELKAARRFQPGQAEMAQLGHWQVAWDVEEAKAHVRAWEEDAIDRRAERAWKTAPFFGGKAERDGK